MGSEPFSRVGRGRSPALFILWGLALFFLLYYQIKFFFSFSYSFRYILFFSHTIVTVNLNSTTPPRLQSGLCDVVEWHERTTDRSPAEWWIPEWWIPGDWKAEWRHDARMRRRHSTEYAQTETPDERRRPTVDGNSSARARACQLKHSCCRPRAFVRGAACPGVMFATGGGLCIMSPNVTV